MKKTRVWNSKYFYGNEIGRYALEHGYLDYRTLASSFNAVMVNDITKLFYADINGEYNEPEQVNGYIDNSEQIEELQERIEELEEQITGGGTQEQDEQTEETIKELQEQIEELEREQDEQKEIYQYFIISDNGAEILQEFTDDPVYYLPALNCYVWGVTHFGMPWVGVFTDVKLEIEQQPKYIKVPELLPIVEG